MHGDAIHVPIGGCPAAWIARMLEHARFERDVELAYNERFSHRTAKMELDEANPRRISTAARLCLLIFVQARASWLFPWLAQVYCVAVDLSRPARLPMFKRTDEARKPRACRFMLLADLVELDCLRDQSADSVHLHVQHAGNDSRPRQPATIPATCAAHSQARAARSSLTSTTAGTTFFSRRVRSWLPDEHGAQHRGP